MADRDPAEFQLQQDYYARTADAYDEAHNRGEHEHDFALTFLLSHMRAERALSLLDIGSGTGRAIQRVRSELPDVRVVGVEPSAALRTVGYDRHGIGPSELVDGNALDLQFANKAFDVVSALGALHHIRTPARAIREMLRVARKAIFISDSNNFGQGSYAARTAKQLLNALGLWPLVVRLKTTGKLYHSSEGDGIYYSYSVFNDYRLIRASCTRVYVVNSKGEPAINMYREASHVALLGLKEQA